MPEPIIHTEHLSRSFGTVKAVDDLSLEVPAGIVFGFLGPNGAVAREGVTVFLNTHNLTEAEKLCAQVAVIRQGKLLAVGAPDELRAKTGGPQAEIVGRGFTEQILATLRERPEVAHAELHNSHLLLELRGESKMGPLVRLLVQAGAEVEEVRRGKASLEDVFLTLMEEEQR